MGSFRLFALTVTKYMSAEGLKAAVLAEGLKAAVSNARFPDMGFVLGILKVVRP